MEILQRNDGRQSISSDYLVTRRSLPFRLLWTSGSVENLMSLFVAHFSRFGQELLGKKRLPGNGIRFRKII